jgi:hypothetical protein
MPSILFPIKDTLLELESAKSIAGEFLENEELAFAQMRTQLEGLRDERTGNLSWKIPPSKPLRTIVSDGEYDRGGGGGAVVGTLSFLWEIARVHPKKKRAPAEHFQLVGIASTVSRVFTVNDNGSQGDELAMWRMEIGDDNSPGCHFHVQIRGENDDGPFPKSLPVPRLPSCLATPMAALEFMLAELFQERWKRHLFSETDALKRWRAIQRARFSKILAWQGDEISSSNRSPWSALKAARPPEDLFLE